MLFKPPYTPIGDKIMRRRDLSFGAKCTYARLCRYADESGRCYPSLETLGSKLGISDSQARRYVRELQKVGIVKAVKVGIGRGHSTNYVVESPEKVAKMPPFRERKGGNRAGFSARQKGGNHAAEKVAMMLDQKVAKMPAKETIGRDKGREKQKKNAAAAQPDDWLNTWKVLKDLFPTRVLVPFGGCNWMIRSQIEPQRFTSRTLQGGRDRDRLPGRVTF